MHKSKVVEGVGRGSDQPSRVFGDNPDIRQQQDHHDHTAPYAPDDMNSSRADEPPLLNDGVPQSLELHSVGEALVGALMTSDERQIGRKRKAPTVGKRT